MPEVYRLPPGETLGRPLTADEFDGLPDTRGFELEDGRVVPVTGGARASLVAGAAFIKLAALCDTTRVGYAFPPGCPIACFPGHPDLVRKPDVTFVRHTRMPVGQIPRGSVRVVPEFVVEVVAAADTAGGLQRRLLDYQRAGVDVVWVLYPALRCGSVIGGSRSWPVTMSAADDGWMDGGPALPDLRVSLRELFAGV